MPQISGRDRMPMPDRTARIRVLNDRFRQTLLGGRVVMTRGLLALEEDVVRQLLRLVQTFDDFSADNDPYAEHDFGAVTWEGIRIFWKIDYYDRALSAGSPDSADPSRTTRVLTIMLAEEY